MPWHFFKSLQERTRRSRDCQSAFFYATGLPYFKALNKDSLRGKRIGIPRNAIFTSGIAAVDKAINDAFDDAIKVIKAAGAIIVDNTDFGVVEEGIRETNFPADGLPKQDIVIGVDFYAELSKYTTQLKTNLNNITDLKSLADYTQYMGELEQFPEKNINVWLGLLQLLHAVPYIRRDSPKFYEQFISTVNGVWAREGSITAVMAGFNVDGFIMPSTSSHFFPGL